MSMSRRQRDGRAKPRTPHAADTDHAPQSAKSKQYEATVSWYIPLHTWVSLFAPLKLDRPGSSSHVLIHHPCGDMSSAVELLPMEPSLKAEVVFQIQTTSPSIERPISGHRFSNVYCASSPSTKRGVIEEVQARSQVEGKSCSGSSVVPNW